MTRDRCIKRLGYAGTALLTIAMTGEAPAQNCPTQWVIRDIFADGNLTAAEGTAADIDGGWVAVQRWGGEDAYRYHVALRQLEHLGSLGGTWGSIVTGTAPGAACGYSGTAQGDSHAYIWTENAGAGYDAGLNDLGVIEGGNLSVAVDVNSAKHVAGWGFDANNDTRAVFWHPAYTDFIAARIWATAMIQLPGGTHSEAVAVAGTANRPVVVGQIDHRAAVWDLSFSPPSGRFSWSSFGVGAPHMLAGSSSGASDATNDGSVIVGYAQDGDGHARARRWNRSLSNGLTITTPLGTLGGTTSRALAINEAGQVVGSAKDADGNDRGVIWQGNQPIDLNSLLSSAGGWTLEYATGIDEAGRICGTGTRNGLTRPFVMWPDADLDSVPDLADNCPCIGNHGQLDADGDGVGNPCDNCQITTNPDQADTDGDGIGDACDPPPPGDFNNDWTTDVGDLLAYLDAWFGGAGPADVDRNGAINVGDLLAFLDSWFQGV